MIDRARARFVESLGGLELIEAAHARPHFPPHAHATYAVGLVDRGVNRFRYRGAWHAAPAGTLCTVTPDEIHTVEPAGAVGFAYRCLYPPARLLAEIAEGLGARPRGTILLPPVLEDPEAARLAAALLAAIDAGAPALAAEARLASLLERLLARHGRPALREERPPAGGAVARARELLEARLAENVTLRDLAAAAGLPGSGRFGLLRAFARAHGLPPHAWVIQERVRRAQALLRGGRRPAEVALEVGFTDQSHLNRHFTRLVGVTPGRYRAAGAPSAR